MDQFTDHNKQDMRAKVNARRSVLSAADWLNPITPEDGYEVCTSVVVVLDYRLYPEVRYPAFLDDGVLAVKWAKHNARIYGGDPGRPHCEDAAA